MTGQGDTSETAAEDPEDIRDQVRRAVEMTRNEIEGETAPSLDANSREPGLATEPSSASAAIVERPKGGPDLDGFFGIPTLVIENPGGRVELANVYQMLAKLDCAASANLVNYLAHGVTITVGEPNLPEGDRIKRAVESAFGRGCHIVVDGKRATIRLDSQETKVA
jgi:hypothetical protein